MKSNRSRSLEYSIDLMSRYSLTVNRNFGSSKAFPLNGVGVANLGPLVSQRPIDSSSSCLEALEVSNHSAVACPDIYCTPCLQVSHCASIVGSVSCQPAPSFPSSVLPSPFCHFFELAPYRSISFIVGYLVPLFAAGEQQTWHQRHCCPGHVGPEPLR